MHTHVLLQGTPGGNILVAFRAEMAWLQFRCALSCGMLQKEFYVDLMKTHNKGLDVRSFL